LAYDHSTGIASLRIRDTYGVLSDSVGVIGPGSSFSMVYIGIENRAYDDAKWLDNVAMWQIPLSGLPDDANAAGRQLSLYPPFPNPCGKYTLISYEVPTAGDVSITIYDTAGRCVADWHRSGVAPGYHEVRWDAATRDGGRVAPGVYVCSVAAGGEARSQKLIVTR
jgi:hypothetical protein